MGTYRGAGVVLFDTQIQFAVQVDFPSFPTELEHFEGEVAGCSLSIALHNHGFVRRVTTAV